MCNSNVNLCSVQRVHNVVFVYFVVKSIFLKEAMSMFSNALTAMVAPSNVGRNQSKKRKNQIESNNAQVTVVQTPKRRVKAVVEKKWMPRKKLILVQVYSLNWSNTKQVILGIDVENEFEPIIYFAKHAPPENSGVYLRLDTYQALMSPKNIEIINHYFSSAENVKPETLEINQRVKVQFRTFYNQKSIVISDAVTYENMYTDTFVIQDKSWSELFKVSNCVVLTMKTLDRYCIAYKNVYDYIYKKTCDSFHQNIDFNDLDSIEMNVRNIYESLGKFNPEEVQQITLESMPLAGKIYVEVHTLCGNKIVDDISYIMKLTYGTVHGSQIL